MGGCGGLCQGAASGIEAIFTLFIYLSFMLFNLFLAMLDWAFTKFSASKK